MGWYFRKSFGSGPFRVNLSKSGISTSFGVKGARLNVGPRGTYISVGSHGVYYRQRIDAPARNSLPSIGHPQAPEPSEPPIADEPLHPTFKVPLSALQESSSDQTIAQLNASVSAFNPAILSGLFSMLGFFFVFQVFQSVLLILVFAGTALYLTLSLHRKFTREHTTELTYELDDLAKDRLGQVSAAVSVLAQSQRLWRVDSRDSTSDLKRNAGAAYLINRKAVQAGNLALPPRIKCNLPISGLNLISARFYFLPEHILVFASGKIGAIPYSAFRVSCATTRFIETECPPSDAAQVGSTWRFVNKNGGPDRRFNNNRQYPILQYAELSLTTGTGIQVLVHVSSVNSGTQFCNLLTQSANAKASQSKRQESKGSGAEKANAESSLVQAYRVLEITPPVTEESAAVAYKRMAAMYHPDKVATLGPELRALAEAKMKEINSSYEAVRASLLQSRV